MLFSAMWFCIVALAVSAFAEPISSPWLKFQKSDSTRSLGPPFSGAGMSSIAVPFKPKSPFFPKFVDPKAMISKKTSMLSNLFGGIQPVDYGYQGGADEYLTPGSGGFPFIDTKDVYGMPKMAREIATESKEARSMFSPKFGAKPYYSPPFMPGFGSSEMTSSPKLNVPYSSLDDSSSRRRRRSTSDLETVESAAGVPKELMLSGIFGPIKTPAFIDPSLTVTDIPVPKSTIVPADFWMPSSIIPGPMEYTDKVSQFLDKLFDSVAMKKMTPANVAGTKTSSARALDETSASSYEFSPDSVKDFKSIGAIKDSIVDSIMSELGELKADIIGTVDNFVAYQKSAAAAAAAAFPSKKPFKPLSPFAAYFAPPTPDPASPFKEKIAALSQVFDMLTALEKNITLAVQNVVNSPHSPKSSDSSAKYPQYYYPSETSELPLNSNDTLMDRIKSRLASLDRLSNPVLSESLPIDDFQEKREAEMNSGPEYDRSSEDNESGEVRKRLVKMQMHQGYQSMPPGTVESVQAGGGSVTGHQGGGIKLLDWQKMNPDWFKWANNYKDHSEKSNGMHRNHHNHH